MERSLRNSSCKGNASCTVFFIISVALLQCYGMNVGLQLLDDCVCSGYNVTYECKTMGPGSTIFIVGSAQECEIDLRHSQFVIGAAIGQCSNGAVIGRGVQINGSFYTSELHISVNSNLVGKRVTCEHYDGLSQTVVGSIPLTLTTNLVPPPSPETISVTVSARKLVFSWDPVEFNCPSLNYSFASSPSCGICNSITPTAATCTAFNASSSGADCSFNIWSMICGNIRGPTLTLSVNLKVPDAPLIESTPRYLNSPSTNFKLLIGLLTKFNLGEPFMISDGIDGSADNFTITYSDTTFNSICGSFTIPASSCIDGMCSHNFNILNNSLCPSTSMMVTVYGTNVFGNGSKSNVVTRDVLNSLVDVNFDHAERTIVCTFINQEEAVMRQCEANITYGNKCDQPLNVYEGEDIGNAVSTSEVERVPGVAEYCFVVTAISRDVTVMVEGTFVNIVSTSDNTVVIVVSLVLLLLLVLLTVAILTIAYKSVKKPLTTYSVKFSVEDKPGSLPRALRIFKDNKVNILGVNTHLHHAAFDRDAGNGYKYNHIHCLCSEEDKQSLQRTFKDIKFVGTNQHTGGEDKFPLTAIIKVKNKSGGLWEVLDTIGNQGIYLLGVNTRAERESTRGYKDNYVRCSCSTDDMQKLETGLRDIGVINIRIEFHVQKDFQTKAIKYLVRDEVGALASTLEIFSTLGLNISGVNLEHMGTICHKTVDGHKLNFVECSIDDATKKKLFNELRTDYGAIDVELYEEPQIRTDADTDYKIVKITIQDEKRSLNRILQAFSDLQINLHGVNVLYPAFNREDITEYKHYHLEITATSDQERELRDRLYERGLAIDVMPFNLNNYTSTDTAEPSVPNQTVSNKPDDTELKVVSDRNPQTKTIEFSVRDKVGALADALQIFGDLGINITKVNPAHLSQEYKSEYVECNCEPGKRESLIKKLETYGATKAMVLPEKEVPRGMGDAEPNYCVVAFSVGNELGAIVKVFKSFPELGVNIIKVNPPHIKLQNQYVECCCDEEVRTSVVMKLKTINGVTHVRILPEGDAIASHQDPNYCVIKFTVGEAAGILVRALRVFFDNDINIIGVNSLNLAFERKSSVTFKQNNVVFLATGDQVSELKHKLLVTGVALDVEEYEYKAQDDTQPIKENEMELTGIRVHQSN